MSCQIISITVLLAESRLAVQCHVGFHIMSSDPSSYPSDGHADFCNHNSTSVLVHGSEITTGAKTEDAGQEGADDSDLKDAIDESSEYQQPLPPFQFIDCRSL